MENKNEWRKVKLGDIGEIITGKTPSTKKSDDLGNDYLFLTPKDMTGEKNKYKTERNVSIKIAQKNNQLILKKNSICISCIGSDMGKVCIVKKISLTNQQINSITNVKEDFNYEFIYYKLSMMKEYFKTIAGGTTIPILNKNDFSKIKILIPEIGIQKKITKILSDIDSKIELNNKINDNLEKQCVTIFKKMFSSIFYGSSNVGNYLKPKRGKNLLSKNAILGDIPVVAGGLEPAIYHNKSNTQSPVITISASGANAGFIRLWHIPVWSSDSSYIDYSVSKYIYFWYVFLKLRQNEIYDLQSGSAQPHIYPKHLEELSIDELDIKLVKNFNEITSSFFEKIGKNNIENKKLSNLKNYLLPKLMNGEIDVENIEL